jgi:proteic killer suppression protein
VSFKSKRLARFYRSGFVRGLRFANQARVESVFSRLDAYSLEQFTRPQDRLYRLRGNLNGFWSVRISANYRIIFRWVDGEGAHDVDLLDYH